MESGCGNLVNKIFSKVRIDIIGESYWRYFFFCLKGF